MSVLHTYYVYICANMEREVPKVLFIHKLRVCDCCQKHSFSVLWLHLLWKDKYLYHEPKEGLTALTRQHSLALSYRPQVTTRSQESLAAATPLPGPDQCSIWEAEESWTREKFTCLTHSFSPWHFSSASRNNLVKYLHHFLETIQVRAVAESVFCSTSAI